MKLQNKIIFLREKGLKFREIADKLNVSISQVQYYLHKEKRNKARVESFRNKSLEERRKVYKRNNDYQRRYKRERYAKDEEYREKLKAKAREYYNKSKKMNSYNSNKQKEVIKT